MDVIDPLEPSQRAVRTIQWDQHVKPMEEPPGWRVSSGAFKPGKDGSISVDLEESLRRKRLPINADVDPVDRAVAKVAHQVGTYESLEMPVRHAPLPRNEHHGEARRGPGCGSKNKVARELANGCEFLSEIEGEALEELKRTYARG